MTHAEALTLLARAIEQAGTQRAFAKAHGLHEASVSRAMTGQIEMTEAIANALGLVRRVEFVEIRKGSADGRDSSC